MNAPRRILEIRDLSVARGGKAALDSFSLALDAGETVLLLGEADSGKDELLEVLCRAGESGYAAGGPIAFGDGTAMPAGRRTVPPLRIAYLGNPFLAPLNPYASTVSQLARIVAQKQVAPASTGREELRAALDRFAAAPSLASLARKPRELRAAQLAWALLACALAQRPDLLIADQSFAGLDPTASQALAEALAEEQKHEGFALIYAAQGLLTAARLRGRTIVMRRGKVVEEGDFEKLAAGQCHAYTRTLFQALPCLSPPLARGAARAEPVLQVQGLVVRSRNRRDARDGITFELRRSASLALVGEEGSGRHALVQAMIGLSPLRSGRVALDQVDISLLSPRMASRLRRRIAFIAGAEEALDPRMTLWDVVDEPLRAHLRLPRAVVAGHRENALKRVGLFSHEGRTRVGALCAFDKRRLQVARAIVSAPILVIIDEPLRGLDAMAQTIMLELLVELRKQEGPAFLIVTADFRVARALADDVMVLKDRKLVERGSAAQILRAPKDAETRRLLSAAGPGWLYLPSFRAPQPDAAAVPGAPAETTFLPFQAGKML